MFAEFEHAAHRAVEDGGSLTADKLDGMFLEILRRYWGPTVDLDDRHSARTWCRIPHFYYNYYVYQYATAFAASVALSRRLAARVRTGTQNTKKIFTSPVSSTIFVTAMAIKPTGMRKNPAIQSFTTTWWKPVTPMLFALQLQKNSAGLYANTPMKAHTRRRPALTVNTMVLSVATN
jgi:hypothetical protein